MIAAELTHNALLAVSGDDARAFLHGQFTNDVEALGVGEAQWNSWLTAKGRMLASFLLVRRADHFLLMLPAEIAEAVAKRLRMFVLRSKVKVEDVTAANVRLGIVGLVASEMPAPMRSTDRDGVLCVGLEPERFVIVAPNAMAQGFRETLLRGSIPAGPDAWEAFNIRAGVPTIVAATQEAFTPQMVNFELIGGVSFKKGCYPGQEIVARTHYRGGLKRRMALAHFAAGEAPKPGDPLYSTTFGEQAAGAVANVAPAPEGGFDALVVAQLESLASNDLHWKSLDGPALVLKPLPYDVPK
jgi:folate-binding protein YgfZ